MSEIKSQTLSGVAETLLIPLYIRAMESQRPDALIKDEKAVELVARLSADDGFRRDMDRIRQIRIIEMGKVTRILQSCEMDRQVRDFLRRHPEAVVVHIGCGLDARFERIGCNQPDIGQVEWYDLDLPEVIELRRVLFGDEGERHHLLACSVLDEAWLDIVSAHRPRPFLFLADGVFIYLQEAQVRSLVLTLCDRFPGAELVFDVLSPLEVWEGNRRFARNKLDARLHWGIWHGQVLERWGDPSTSLSAGGIRLLDEWGFLDRPEPRLGHLRWLRPLESLARSLRIYHFQLGMAAEGE